MPAYCLKQKETIAWFFIDFLQKIYENLQTTSHETKKTLHTNYIHINTCKSINLREQNKDRRMCVVAFFQDLIYVLVCEMFSLLPSSFTLFSLHETMWVSEWVTTLNHMRLEQNGSSLYCNLSPQRTHNKEFTESEAKTIPVLFVAPWRYNETWRYSYVHT